MGSTPERNDPAAAGGHPRRRSHYGDDHTMEDQRDAARPACRDDIWSFKTCHTRHVEHSASTPIQRPTYGTFASGSVATTVRRY